MACVHHFEGENETTAEGHDTFFEKIWGRDGAREVDFVEKFLYWKLCITSLEVAYSVPANRVGTVSSVLQTVFFSLLWSCYLQAAYLRCLKILSGAAANSKILFYN